MKKFVLLCMIITMTILGASCSDNNTGKTSVSNGDTGETASTEGVADAEVDEREILESDDWENDTSGIFSYKIVPTELSKLKKDTIVITGIDESVTGAVTIPKKIDDYIVAYIDRGIFNYSDATELTIPSTVIQCTEFFYEDDEAYAITEGHSLYPGELENIFVEPENKYYCSVDGVLYSKDKKSLLTYPKENKRESYTVLDGVTIIASAAFEHSDNLKEIILPDSVKEIRYRAFSSCDSIEEFIIPEGTEIIGQNAFFGCENLKSLTVPKSIKEMNSILKEGTINYAGSAQDFLTIKMLQGKQIGDLDLSKLTINFGE